MGTATALHSARPQGVSTARDSTYDCLRVIATACVLLGHSFYTRINEVSGGVYYTLPEAVHLAYFVQPWELLSRLAGWVYDFHMPLFFLLSGAVLALRPLPPLGRFIAGKARRLLLPFALCGFLYMLPLKYLGGFYDGPGLAAAYQGFLLGRDTGHLWFLPALFWCMAVFVLLAAGFARLGRAQLPVLVSVCALVSAAAHLVPGDLFLLCRGMEYLIYFALGYCFQQLRSRSRPWGLWALAGALAGLLAVEYANYRLGFLGDFGKALAGSALCLVLARILARLPAVFMDTALWRVLAGSCFGIYLFHDPLEYLVLRVFFEGGLLASAAGCWGYYLCRIAGVPLLSFALALLTGRITQAVKKRHAPKISA